MTLSVVDNFKGIGTRRRASASCPQALVAVYCRSGSTAFGNSLFNLLGACFHSFHYCTTQKMTYHHSSMVPKGLRVTKDVLSEGSNCSKRAIRIRNRRECCRCVSCLSSELHPLTYASALPPPDHANVSLTSLDLGVVKYLLDLLDVARYLDVLRLVT